MSLRRTLLVAGRDYVENLRAKGFWIGILAVPILIVISVVVPILLTQAKDARRYAVLDQSGWLLGEVERRAVGDDARKLLQFLRREAGKGEDALKDVPAPVRDLALAVKDATDEEIEAVAADLGGSATPGSSPVTQRLRTKLDLVRADVMTWMASLDPREARALGASLSRGRYERVEIPPGTADPEAWLREQLELSPKQGGLFGYFVIGPDPVGVSEGSKYVSKNFADSDLREWFSRMASEIVEARRFENEGVAADAARRIKEPLRFAEKQIAGGEETGVSRKDRARQFAPVAFVYLLWMTVFMTASSLLTNTIEEKSNRLIEVLLSSVSPLEMLSGKIIGTAATGLTLVGAWVLCFIGTLALLPSMLGGGQSFGAASIAGDPVYLASFVSYYLLGYLLYAAILVALGSVCDSLKDAQSLMSPVTILMIVPLLAMLPVAQDPNGTLAKVLSWFPPFTPFVMMNRAAGPPAWWEYVGTTILLVVTVIAAFWMSAKIFRVGILMTGKPPRFMEIMRWLRAPVGATPSAPSAAEEP